MGVQGSEAQLKRMHDDIRDLEATLRGDSTAEAWKDLNTKLQNLKASLKNHIQRIRHDSNQYPSWADKFLVE